MTKEQKKAFEAIVKWQEATIKGTKEHTRAMIAGSMVMTMLPLTNGQLQKIDEIINY
jgi:hypothetical protein